MRTSVVMGKEMWTRVSKLMLVGAISFWLPDTILHAFRAYYFNSLDVRIITAVMPLTLLCSYVAMKWVNKDSPPTRIGLPMLAGVWFLGGLFMALSASFSGGGFMMAGGMRTVGVVLLLSLFPMYTFIMATYDGSLAALLLVSGVAVLVWAFQSSGLLVRLGFKRARKSP